MKKLIIMILCLGFVLSLVGCGTKAEQNENQQIEAENLNTSILDFSYAEDSAIYVEGEPGVKTSGFVNTTESNVNLGNIVEVAKAECTIEYNNSKIYQDTVADIWKVDFFTDGTLGNCQTVYLDSNGRTVLIVYGE